MCSTVIEFWCRVGAILEISQNCQKTINLNVIHRIEKKSGHDTQNMVKIGIIYLGSVQRFVAATSSSS